VWSVRCPTTGALGLVLYSVDRLTWGFSFHVPKFAGRQELYVVCDALICDHEAAGTTGTGAAGTGTTGAESKTYCDRSCVQPASLLAPAATTAAAAQPPVRMRRLAPPTDDDDDDDAGMSASGLPPSGRSMTISPAS